MAGTTCHHRRRRRILPCFDVDKAATHGRSKGSASSWRQVALLVLVWAPMVCTFSLPSLAYAVSASLPPEEERPKQNGWRASIKKPPFWPKREAANFAAAVAAAAAAGFASGDGGCHQKH